MSGEASANSTPKPDTVLIAIDGSASAEEAFEWYVEHLHKDGNTVILIQASEIPSMPTRDSWDHQVADENKKRAALQEKYQARFNDLGIAGKFVSDFEKPGPFICANVKKHDATYIVMGTRGMGKIRRTIMGSVSDYVIHHAECPVMVCRNRGK